MRRRAAALAALICALTGAAAADAGAAWVEPVSISQLDASAREPRIAVDAAGNLTAVWTTGAEGSRSVRSAFRPAGGSWEAPFNRMTSTFDCHDPRLAVNPSGAAVVIASCQKPSVAVRAAYRPAASWSAQSEVPGSADGKDARVGIDDSGNARAVWAGPGSTVHSSYRSAAGTWSAVAQQVSTVGKLAFDPNVGVSPAGYAFAVWREKREGSAPGDPVVHARISTSLKGAAWSAPFSMTVDTGAGAVTPITEGEPQIAINAGAERMMAWSVAGTNATMGERTAFSDTSGLSEPVRFITEAPAHVEIPQIAIDGEARGVAVWRSFVSAEGFRIKASTTPTRTGSWAPPTILADLSGGINGGTEPDVAADPAGNATVVWSGGGTATASSRPAGGAFGPATPISNGAHTVALGGPRVMMTAGGDALVAWSANTGGGTHIALAVDDVTPPAISSVAIPAAVETGASAAMSAASTDTWSSSTLSWDFGDGATATGDAVSHAYATAGNHTVTITATDAVGNSAGETRQISVAPPPGAGGPASASGTKKRVRLGVTVPKQTWKKILKAKAVKLRCSLDVPGACSVKATVTRAVAKHLGLKLGKGARAATVGSGSVALKGGDEPGTLKAKLTGRARKAIGTAAKPVPVVLTVTGSAPGRESATLSRTLRIKRP